MFEVHCYRMTWTSLDERVHPTDCYELTAAVPAAGAGSHWYGGGRPADMKWPLEAGRVGYAPFLTGDSVSGRHQWGNVLRRYFISSKGVAITVDPSTPLYMSVDEKMCLQVNACTSPNPISAQAMIPVRNLVKSVYQGKVREVEFGFYFTGETRRFRVRPQAGCTSGVELHAVHDGHDEHDGAASPAVGEESLGRPQGRGC